MPLVSADVDAWLEGSGADAEAVEVDVCDSAASISSPFPVTVDTLSIPLITKRSQILPAFAVSMRTRLLTSLFFNLPPLLANSRMRVSLTTRNGRGSMRSCMQSVCSAALRRCRLGAVLRVSGLRFCCDASDPEACGSSESRETRAMASFLEVASGGR